MTTIRFKHTTRRFMLHIEGHADYAPAGKDILCASISTMASLVLMACEKAAAKNEISVLKSELASGLIHVDFEYQKANSSIREIVQLITEALSELEKQYPKHIHLEAV